MNIYVGNLAFSTTEAEIKTTFEAYGSVDSARVIMDRETNRSKGFCFVEMPNSSEANAAIKALNGSSLDDRQIVVNESRPRQPRDNNRGGGGGGFGGGRNRY